MLSQRRGLYQSYKNSPIPVCGGHCADCWSTVISVMCAMCKVQCILNVSFLPITVVTLPIYCWRFFQLWKDHHILTAQWPNTLYSTGMCKQKCLNKYMVCRSDYFDWVCLPVLFYFSHSALLNEKVPICLWRNLFCIIFLFCWNTVLLYS